MDEHDRRRVDFFHLTWVCRRRCHRLVILIITVDILARRRRPPTHTLAWGR
jgi:hypothetical protein